MSDLEALLREANVRRALVIDDAYDNVPSAQDLSADQEEWTHFFEDLQEDDLRVLRDIYPDYDLKRADELPSEDSFVAAIWARRNDIRAELVGPLFERYNKDIEEDRRYTELLVTALRQLGLECDTAGRSFKDKALQADLIIIDLFLGSTQNDVAIDVSISGLVDVINSRPKNPPLTILMSRSSRLTAKREEFRDKSGLFESAFRIIRKAELAEKGKLERIITRLALHYRDSVRLASFLSSWRTGVSEARDRTSDLIRTLDLTDIAQLRELLLSLEGAPTGSYLVDVFDKVLNHEVERDRSIIDAAIELNRLNTDSYPPPYVAGSRDLQDLVYRSLFQNNERLRLPGTMDSRLAFGDVLRRKIPNESQQSQDNPAAQLPLREITLDNVLAVMTPACDLQRSAAEKVLLVVGSLKQLQPTDWSYSEMPIRTPVIKLQDERFWIKWDLKHIETASHQEIEELLDSPTGIEIIARLRESHALELQQKLLSSLGRVGVISPMPASFPMRVEAYLPDPDGKLFQLEVQDLSKNEGVCVIGRTGNKDMRLILCEDACEGLCTVIEKTQLDRVHKDTRELLTALKSSGELCAALEKGIVLPGPDQKGFKDIEVSSAAAPETKRSIGLVIRGESIVGTQLKGSQPKNAGVVIAASDIAKA